MLERIKAIHDHVASIQGRLATLDHQINTLEEREHVLKREHQETLHVILIHRKGVEVLKEVVSRMSQGGIDALEGIISDGLRAIYYDRDYSIKIEVQDKGRNKSAEMLLINKSDQDTATPLKDATGGGIQTVVGLILRVYFIIALRLKRFMILDESVYALSDRYVKTLYEFLRELRDVGFTFLIVSHDPRSLAYADRIYRVENGEFYEE